MSQIHESRKSDHPYIETVWRTRNIQDGVYVATPDTSWDLIVMIQADGSKQMMLTGQATKSMDVPYTAGTSSVVVSFVPGAYMPAYPGNTLLDSFVFLSNADAEHFELAGHIFTFPTFDNAEALVGRLTELGILHKNDVVDRALSTNPKALSERSVQRHFTNTTGMSRKSFEQIRRAQHAVRLLKDGASPADAAQIAGYADQPHMAKSIKKLMNTRPSAVDDIHKLT